MANELLNRRLATIAAIFALISVLFGVFALSFNYWTYNQSNGNVSNETIAIDIESNEYYYKGLFKECKSDGTCTNNFLARIFLVCLLGVISLLIGGIFLLIDIPKITNRHYLTPTLIFMGCALMTTGLVDYGSIDLLNYHCSRMMIVAIIFAYTALPISSFVAGQYSAVQRRILINNENHDPQKYSTTNGNGL